MIEAYFPKSIPKRTNLFRFNPFWSLLLACSFLTACTYVKVRGKPVAVIGQSAPFTVAVVSKNSEELRKLVENALMEHTSATLVVRGEAELIAKEKKLQYDGDFSDASMVSLGQQLGAKILLVVDELELNASIFDRGDSHYVIRLSVLDVENGMILGFSQVDGWTRHMSEYACGLNCLKENIVRMAVLKLRQP